MISAAKSSIPRDEYERALALIRKDSIDESVMAPAFLLRSFDRKSRLGLSL